MIREILNNHPMLQTFVGIGIFFGGYLFLMLIGGITGEWLDERKDNNLEE